MSSSCCPSSSKPATGSARRRLPTPRPSGQQWLVSASTRRSSTCDSCSSTALLITNSPPAEPSPRPAAAPRPAQSPTSRSLRPSAYTAANPTRPSGTALAPRPRHPRRRPTRPRHRPLTTPRPLETDFWNNTMPPSSPGRRNRHLGLAHNPRAQHAAVPRDRGRYVGHPVARRTTRLQPPHMGTRIHDAAGRAD